MKESVKARMQEKDENGNAILIEGVASWKESTVEYDFGDDLNAATELCGADVVFSQYKANATVALQSIIRSSLKAGLTPDQIQTKVSTWKPGMVMAVEKVDPQTAIKNAFATWSPEKKAEFLASLGIQV
jgi:hypothetical protein